MDSTDFRLLATPASANTGTTHDLDDLSDLNESGVVVVKLFKGL